MNQNGKESILNRTFFNPAVPVGVKLVALEAIVVALYFLITFVPLVLFILLSSEGTLFGYEIEEGVVSNELLFIAIYHVVVALLLFVFLPFFMKGKRWAKGIYSMIFITFLGYAFVGLFLLSYTFFILGVLSVGYLQAGRSARRYFGEHVKAKIEFR